MKKPGENGGGLAAAAVLSALSALSVVAAVAGPGAASAAFSSAAGAAVSCVLCAAAFCAAFVLRRNAGLALLLAGLGCVLAARTSLAAFRRSGRWPVPETIRVVEGETRRIGGGPAKMTLDRFSVERHPSGMPKRYSSETTVSGTPDGEPFTRRWPPPARCSCSPARLRPCATDIHDGGCARSPPEGARREKTLQRAFS